MKKILKTGKISPSVGPYSTIVGFKDLVFISGQVAIDPNTNKVMHGTVKEQTNLIMSNIKSILQANDMDIHDILKCNIYMTEYHKYFSEMNEEYSKFFNVPPARVTIEVVSLYDGLNVEIDVIAAKGEA